MAEQIESLDNGVVVFRVTEDEGLVSNIYCERPYCSEDSRRFLYAREMDGGECEYVLCEFGSWDKEPAGRGLFGVPISYNWDFYYLREAAESGTEVMRLDLNTGTSEVAFVFAESGQRMGHPTVSTDRRYLAYHRTISWEPQMFGVEVVDMQTGERQVVCEDPFLCNGHCQFEDSGGYRILVQHNRGCEYTPEGKRVRLVGDEGATVFILDGMSGEITRLDVGKPYSTPLTGHEAWVGRTDEIIMTVGAGGPFAEPEGKGNILVVRAGEEYRQIGAGRVMNHIGTTPCGTYLCADGNADGDIIIGSPATGETVLVCHSHTSYGGRGFGQQGHPHAYLSPDFRWVVFNSDRTERPETYVAQLPEGFVEGVAAG